MPNDRPKLDLASVEALTFDCYGTLIDWEQGILGALRPWAAQAGATISDDKLLALFARAEPLAEKAHPLAPYPEILRIVHQRLADSLSVKATNAQADRFVHSVGDWPVFSDSIEALQRLKRCCKLIVVSNVDRESFAQTSERLGTPFDAVVTAQDVGAYKPDRRMFDAAIKAVETEGVARTNHLHVAQSLYHDIAPAGAMGIATCWVDRRNGEVGGATQSPDATVTPDLTVHSLTQLADAMETAHS